jgi:hypothetical protein
MPDDGRGRTRPKHRDCMSVHENASDCVALFTSTASKLDRTLCVMLRDAQDRARRHLWQLFRLFALGT